MPATSLIICAYRSISVPTHHAVVKLLSANPDWTERVYGEAGINRARSYAASVWWRETDEDVFLMLDDDIVFEPEDAIKIVDRCRNGYDVIAAAYPFRDAKGIAVRSLPGDDRISFGPDAPPHEVKALATGFFAVNRKVLSAMIPTLQECYSGSVGAFWPFFNYRIVKDEAAGGYDFQSEDYSFCDSARELGFKIWLDRSIFLSHLGQIQISLDSMAAIRLALDKQFSPE